MYFAKPQHNTTYVARDISSPTAHSFYSPWIEIIPLESFLYVASSYMYDPQ